MRALAPDSSVPYITVIRGVREVALIGSADPQPWEAELAREGLAPILAHGRAQLVLSAPDLRWSGIRFQELSLGVVVGQPAGAADVPALYLAGAYNSSRLLAYLERTLFETPYEHQATRVEVALPASITVATRAGATLRAAMAPTARHLWRREDVWESAIVLPTQPHAAEQRWFRARIGGLTDAYAFDPAADSFAVTAGAAEPLLRLLGDSQFTPEEWRVRTSSTHARSRTYRWTPATPPVGHEQRAR